MTPTAQRVTVPVAIGALVAALAMTLFFVPAVSADASLTTTLTGQAEVPGPGDNDGSGSGTVEIVGDEICFSVQWELSVDGNVAAAGHIHEAPAGEAGDVVLPLFTEPNDTGMVEGCATDAALAAELEANPANYYINIHSETFPAGAVRGQLAVAGDDGGDPETAMIMIMKHNCANVTSMAEFEEVEARAATNPTTPEAAFGPTVETVLECPTVVLPGDEQTSDTVAGGESTFEFTVADAGGTATLSTDGVFAAQAACETDVSYDADRSGELDADVCLDLSHYSFEVSTDGQVTITETAAPDGLAFGALRFDPGSQDAESLVSAEGGVIVLNPGVAEDGMIMLHVYNFAAAAAAPAPTATPAPAASTLPDAALTPPAAGSSDTTLLGLGLAALALVSLGVIGYRTLAMRRVR